MAADDARKDETKPASHTDLNREFADPKGNDGMELLLRCADSVHDY